MSEEERRNRSFVGGSDGVGRKGTLGCGGGGCFCLVRGILYLLRLLVSQDAIH